jgi:methyl-accepting chemotaxis protein
MMTRLYSALRTHMLAAPIGTMLGVILLLGLLPAFVMGGLYVKRGLGDVAIIDKELEGVELLREIKPVEAFVIDPPADAEARTKQAAKLWQDVRSATNHHRGTIDVSADAEKLIENLRSIAAGVENVDAHRSYSTLVAAIGDQSGLILDPELDTYYLMTIAVQTGPEIARINHDLEAVYNKATASTDIAAALTRHRLAEATRNLKNAAVKASDSSKYSYLANSQFMFAINSTIQASNTMNSSFGGDVGAARVALDKANERSWTMATLALKALLEQRRDVTINGIWISLGISAAAALLVILFAAFVIFAIANGVRSISDRLHDLAAGDHQSPVPGVEYHNDIGVIANALQDFIHLSAEIDEERQRASERLEQTVAQVRAENDSLLAAQLEQQRKASDTERETLARMAADLERQIGELLEGSRRAAMTMSGEAAAMADGSSHVKREAASAAQVAADIRMSVSSVPGTVENVARQLSEYTKSLTEANELAGEAAQRVVLANSRIGDFTAATDKAAAMLDLITKVAQKTNMLALNASIEAVRVGEAGTGFQVVANEVKALALSTRDAASEIAQQIAEMKGVNREVAGAFEQVMQLVDTLATQSSAIATGMQGQARAINGVQQAVNHATEELSSMVGSIEAADHSAAQAQARSSGMLAASRSVSDNVGALDSSVRAFLGGIRNPDRRAA